MNAFRLLICYEAVLVSVFAIGYISSPDKASIYTPMIEISLLSAFILVWLLGRRFKQHFVYFVLLLYVYVSLVNLGHVYIASTLAVLSTD